MQANHISNPEPKERLNTALYNLHGRVVEFDVDIYNLISVEGVVVPGIEWQIYQEDLRIELVGCQVIG